MEKPNLLWETIRYSPQILFNIEPIKRGFRRSLCNDLSHFHYFLESELGFTNIRDIDFTHCKSLLQSQLLDPGLLFHMETGFGYGLKSFDCKTSQVQVYHIHKLKMKLDRGWVARF